MPQIGYTELTGLEQLLMSVLWNKREATAREVHSGLPTPRPAYRTVTKLLTGLCERGLVTRIYADKPRRIVYLPKMSSQDARAEIIQDILSRLFSGSPAILIKHLLETEGFTRDELNSIRDVLDKQVKAIVSVSQQPSKPAS
jgi:BlaI family transcriptional regulator, penicillinase repressor